MDSFHFLDLATSNISSETMLAEIGCGCIDPCSRVLSIRVLEKELAKRGEQELDELFKYVESLSASYREKLLSNTVDQRDLDTVAENLLSVKTILIENLLGVEHLWRELSHLYADMEPERRPPAI